MKEYTVYMHTTLSNKVYIGITCAEPRKRWANGYGYRTQQLFWRAIQKYGWENIHHIIVKDCLSREEAEKLEIELISIYNSTNPNNGYNVSSGGLLNKEGHPMTSETREKISANNKGKRLSDETRKKMSNSRMGEKNWAYGRKFSKEHRKSLSESHLGKIPSNAKPVICVETGRKYNSVAEAQRREHINNIWSACNNQKRTAGGYHWKFLNK